MWCVVSGANDFACKRYVLLLWVSLSYLTFFHRQSLNLDPTLKISPCFSWPSDALHHATRQRPYFFLARRNLKAIFTSISLQLSAFVRKQRTTQRSQLLLNYHPISLTQSSRRYNRSLSCGKIPSRRKWLYWAVIPSKKRRKRAQCSEDLFWSTLIVIRIAERWKQGYSFWMRVLPMTTRLRGNKLVRRVVQHGSLATSLIRPGKTDWTLVHYIWQGS